LGIEISENELNLTMKMLDDSGDGNISFRYFLFLLFLFFLFFYLVVGRRSRRRREEEALISP